MSNIFDILYPSPYAVKVVGGTFQLAATLPEPANAPPVASPSVGGKFALASTLPGPGAFVVPGRAQASAYERLLVYDEALVQNGIEIWPPLRP